MKHYIYTLICPITNTIEYIGKTNNLEKRLRSHLLDKTKSIKNNWIKKLKKLGLVPKIECIEECTDINVDEREIYWISYYRKINPKLKNMTKGGTGGTTHYGRPTKIYRSDGIVFKSVKEASIISNTQSVAIFACLSGKRLQAGGFGWSRDGITFSNRQRKKDPKCIEIFCSNGKKYSSINSAGKELNIFPQNINQCINGKRSSAGGFTFWKEGTNPRSKKRGLRKKIKCLTNNIIYDSIHEAGRQLNICYKQISQCLRQKQKTVHGYSFEYYNENII